MLGAVKLENDFAADLRACNEAVRLDLKEERVLKESNCGDMTEKLMLCLAGSIVISRGVGSSALMCSNG